MSRKVAVILSGCGVYDGSEIHESSAVLVHLSRAGVQLMSRICIPGENLLTWAQEGTLKITFQSRGNPCGFGVAKNLSTWAVQGKDCSVEKAIEETIKAFHGSDKPIGLCCISPVLAAKLIPGCEVTVGSDKECEKWPYAGTAGAIKQLGCKHINKQVDEVHVDTKNKLVTTCAFMSASPLHEVFDGVGEMVAALLKLL
ncbi:glutamine amidotransferase-like class 1 domain-containing protein 3, mitochondrial [Mantella aurantiaca]